VAYSYRVRSWNAGGYSGYSNVASATVGSAAAQAPSAPSGLEARALSKNKIALRWANTATSQSSVRIERCSGVGCSNFAQVAQAGGSATEYTDNRLTAGTSYTYRVQALSAGGASAYSAPANAITTAR
jgi:hypothetical protein